MSSKWDDLAFLLHDVRWQEPEVVRLFQQTIQRSVPMACLPVPRCETCKHWQQWDPYKGVCAIASVGEPPIWAPDGRIFTTIDFGCVAWEAK